MLCYDDLILCCVTYKQFQWANENVKIVYESHAK